ncbi:uncharacterized protein PHACADRAFT_253825 [Phanerochaete carnosa HHB-10118-sp]|uniref:DUF6533 domain-containing protein n=1 Tax=Phanerochaete carnosa (strain HHB-10118-sp) TaxID=650164 RepID=K5V263_PHACS|nr:uncharacterized protein PHACADRAFT_253825 [Phanerochaete carnosa HHB-10118-sp]EKM56616.1 hypothetical protein PHACADRAFT_253825 [Phanerochaete carnosa HHB-10118-sp]
MDDGDAIPLSQVYVHNYLHLLGIVILFYDHAITFDGEFWRVWRTPRSGASILFFVNRYFAFFSNIAITAGNFALFQTIQGCAHYAFYRQLSLIVAQVIVAVIQFLRTYALYGRDRRIVIAVLSVAAILLSLSIWAVVGQTSTYTLAQGCHAASSRTSAIHIAVAWEALFIWDLMIFSLTFFKSIQNRGQYAGGRNDLVSLMIRDGAIYFGVMACAQCSNTLTFYLSPPALRGCLSTFASNMSVTMMSRLMLNLHRTTMNGSRNYDATTTEFGSVMSTNMRFTSRFGTTNVHTNGAHEEDAPSNSRSAGGSSVTAATSEDYEMRDMRTLT